MTNPISARTLLVTYKQCNLKWTLHACKFPKISFDHLSYAWWYSIKYKTLMKSPTVSKDAGFDERKDFWIPPSSYVPSSRNANHFKSCRTPFLRMKRRRRMPWYRNKKSLKWHIENHSTHSIWGLILREILWKRFQPKSILSAKTSLLRSRG